MKLSLCDSLIVMATVKTLEGFLSTVTCEIMAASEKEIEKNIRIIGSKLLQLTEGTLK